MKIVEQGVRERKWAFFPWIILLVACLVVRRSREISASICFKAFTVLGRTLSIFNPVTWLHRKLCFLSSVKQSVNALESSTAIPLVQPHEYKYNLITLQKNHQLCENNDSLFLSNFRGCFWIFMKIMRTWQWQLKCGILCTLLYLFKVKSEKVKNENESWKSVT